MPINPSERDLHRDICGALIEGALEITDHIAAAVRLAGPHVALAAAPHIAALRSAGRRAFKDIAAAREITLAAAALHDTIAGAGASKTTATKPADTHPTPRRHHAIR